MRGGGKTDGLRWSTRVGLLKPKDVIRCDQWSGVESYGWSGTVDYYVLYLTKNGPGWYDVATRLYTSRSLGQDVERVFCIREDDVVTLTARDAELPVWETEYPDDGAEGILIQPKPKKPKKRSRAKILKVGEQAKMFAEDD